jgi:hypothetical protein
VKIPAGADLILFAVGDEAGEQGRLFAQNLRQLGYVPGAIAHIVNVARDSQRGNTVRQAAADLGVPYTEVDVQQLTDVYQVQRTLKAVLEARPYREEGSLVEKIMQTELLLTTRVVVLFEYANGWKAQASKRIALPQTRPPLSTRVGFSVRRAETLDACIV